MPQDFEGAVGDDLVRVDIRRRSGLQACTIAVVVAASMWRESACARIDDRLSRASALTSAGREEICVQAIGTASSARSVRRPQYTSAGISRIPAASLSSLLLPAPVLFGERDVVDLMAFSVPDAAKR